MLVELRQEQDLEQLLEQSQTHPVVIFKHSTQCSRSAAAWEEFQDFVSAHPDVPCGTVLVIEDRDVSDAVEDRFRVRHESPQAIVVRNGSPVWHASHFSVTEKALREALETQRRLTGQSRA
jgi:bacillithiol system protein YtxJ